MLLLIIASLCSILISDYVISSFSAHCFGDIKKVPPKKVGLVLGTVKTLTNGQENLYYTYRVKAAADLFNAKKIQFVLVSGDNSSSNYDEPTAFKTDLIKLGIPEDKIYLDFAGFRTLDSIVRTKEVFNENDFIIIS